jgi:hypothetical protein
MILSNLIKTNRSGANRKESAHKGLRKSPAHSAGLFIWRRAKLDMLRIIGKTLSAVGKTFLILARDKHIPYIIFIQGYKQIPEITVKNVSHYLLMDLAEN